MPNLHSRWERSRFHPAVLRTRCNRKQFRCGSTVIRLASAEDHCNQDDSSGRWERSYGHMIPLTPGTSMILIDDGITPLQNCLRSMMWSICSLMAEPFSIYVSIRVINVITYNYNSIYGILYIFWEIFYCFIELYCKSLAKCSHQGWATSVSDDLSYGEVLPDPVTPNRIRSQFPRSPPPSAQREAVS